ncbi:nad(p)h dehydrogenase [quinone] 1 [Anaeramoeba flamelloides]|uniref:NADPH dehydrogenase n=1 Tax=Anaeramoeba flamelloides TaxID=1746091 RepID=A0AAV7YRV5_9EUKA|nr:NADPH dehydrogenase [Anaeramoeba flamelloides]KAJ6234868.1 nad(p)h dehydrogenase [quinone] 1 [Anaeramoeba flamelloides]
MENGPYKNKKAILSLSTGGQKLMYENKGVNGDISKILYPITFGTLYYSGFEVFTPSFHFGAAHSDKLGKQYIEAWKVRLMSILNNENKNIIEFNKTEKYENGILKSETDKINFNNFVKEKNK